MSIEYFFYERWHGKPLGFQINACKSLEQWHKSVFKFPPKLMVEKSVLVD